MISLGLHQYKYAFSYRAKGTGTPLIAPLQSMPSQHTSSALNTEHNEAHKEHTDVGNGILLNTLVNLNTDTSAYEKCVKLGECSSSLQPAEILQTDTNDAWYSMYNTLNEISLSDASVFEKELPFNPNIDQKDEKGYRAGNRYTADRTTAKHTITTYFRCIDY